MRPVFLWYVVFTDLNAVHHHLIMRLPNCLVDNAIGFKIASLSNDIVTCAFIRSKAAKVSGETCPNISPTLQNGIGST